MQSCFARSSGVVGRPFFSKYDGAATVSTRVSRSRRDDIVEGGCGPKRMETSTPAVIRSPESGRCRIVSSTAGYLQMKRGRFGARTGLENMACKLTRNEPLTAPAEPDAKLPAS